MQHWHIWEEHYSKLVLTKVSHPQQCGVGCLLWGFRRKMSVITVLYVHSVNKTGGGCFNRKCVMDILGHLVNLVWLPLSALLAVPLIGLLNWQFRVTNLAILHAFASPYMNIHAAGLFYFQSWGWSCGRFALDIDLVMLIRLLYGMGLLPNTQHYVLRMRRKCRERPPPPSLGLAIPTCIMARAWRTCRDACRDR